MIRKNLSLIIFLCSFFSYTQTENCTSIYLIRHAEKIRDNSENKNPHLNKKGILRAHRWKNIFKHIEFDKIFSTDLFRTLETAKPISEHNGLKIITYTPSKIYYENFIKNNEGKTIFVVGHSNTTPAFVNALIEKKLYSDIKDDNNGNLYYVNKCDDSPANHVLYFIN